MTAMMKAFCVRGSDPYNACEWQLRAISELLPDIQNDFIMSVIR